MARLSRVLATFALAGSCCLLASCLATTKALTEETRVETSEEVANVYVSAYPAVPWSSISSKLEPKNNLSTADARAMAALTTQSQVNQVLSMLSGGLAIGLPGHSLSRTTTTDSTGTSTTTTKSLAPGAAASSSGAAALGLTDANLSPDLTKNPFVNGVDANTQLMGGLGVYQLAQILDNQISNELQPKGYQAYLVTFQVNLQPRRRDLPYDAYVNLTLMPGSWHKAIASAGSVSKSANELSPIIVYPLIVTDAMETSSVGRSVESIRQAELALSGVIANVGLSAGVNKGSDDLASLLGSDRNSLVTAGRISDNTIRIRLGAQFQGSSKYAIVPRTQNVSVVVFTKTGTIQEEHLDKLAVITNTTFIDSKNGGAPLPSSRGEKDRNNLAAAVQHSVSTYGFALNPACGKGVDQANDLLRAADRQDFVYLSKCLLVSPGEVGGDEQRPRASFAPALTASGATEPCDPLPNCLSLLKADDLMKSRSNAERLDLSDERFTPFEEAKLRRLIAELMLQQADSRYSKLMIQLADFQSTVAHAPEAQLAFLADGKGGSKVTLRGSSNVDAAKLKPMLQLTRDGKSVSLYPSSVAVDSSGVVTVGFPGIASSKLMSTTVTKVAGKDQKSSVAPEPITLLWRYAKTGTDGATASELDAGPAYTVQMLTAEEDAPSNPVSVTSSILRPDSTNTAKLTIFVDKWDASKGALVLRVSNADIRSVDPATALDATKKGLPLSAGTSLTLTLSNMSPAAPVQLKTFGGGDAIGNTITLPVEPLQTAAR